MKEIGRGGMIVYEMLLSDWGKVKLKSDYRICIMEIWRCFKE